MRVYVSGPYTQGNVNTNVRRAMDAGALILDAGHEPFVPHLCHFWDVTCPRSYDQWLRWCLSWVEVCDVLLRLPGASSGADREVARARELGIPMFEDLSPEFWSHLSQATAEECSNTPKTTRSAEILVAGQWERHAFSEIREGDIFRLFEDNGDLVDGGEICLASGGAAPCGDTFRVPSMPAGR